MPKSNRHNAQPGRHGRSPDTENPAQWVASLCQRRAEEPATEPTVLPPILLSDPPTLAELVAARAALPPLSADAPRASLAERFLLPPFSVLDARQGYWQKRKKMWLALGIQSELGRGETGVNTPYDGVGAAADLEALRERRAAAKDDNGLLGISKQARSHYRTNATVTGSPMPATSKNEDGTIRHGDGRGRPLATTKGSGGPGDLAKTFGTGGPGTMDEQRREWRKQDKQRGAHAIPGGGTGKNSAYMFKTADGYKPLKEIQAGETASLDGLTHGTTIHPYDGSSSEGTQSGTSIFDPVLCEIAYRWFCPRGGVVLDPFAGGSVRGIVAAKLGRSYAGVDLRPEQAEANYVQAEALCPDADLTWVVGDSLDVVNLVEGKMCDLIFSCPPYADLERYSDDPRDLSTMDYAAFVEAYRNIIAASCSLLKDDRFAVFVVGDVRDTKTGFYRNFVGDTVAAFRAAGLELYNDAVLVTAVGSLPIRVGKQFAGYRKLGKTHQNVLVFVKGDPALAAAACGEVDVDDFEMPECVEDSIALCRQDVQETFAEQWLMDKTEVSHLYLPPVESYLAVDVMRGMARAGARPIPRAWLCTKDGWQSVDDNVELTYLIGSTVYLNQSVFPGSARPTDAPPPPKKLR